MSTASIAMRDVAALAAGPPLVDPEVAGQFFGYGRAWTYELLRRGELPVRSHKIAGRFKIPVHGPGGLLDALGVTLAELSTLDSPAGPPAPVPTTVQDGPLDHIPPAA